MALLIGFYVVPKNKTFSLSNKGPTQFTLSNFWCPCLVFMEFGRRLVQRLRLSCAESRFLSAGTELGPPGLPGLPAAPAAASASRSASAPAATRARATVDECVWARTARRGRTIPLPSPFLTCHDLPPPLIPRLPRDAAQPLFSQSGM